MLRTTSLVAVLLLAAPAVASEGCIVDYESFELRAIAADDPASMLKEQTLSNYDWGRELDVVVAGERYEKYGLPRVLFLDEVVFHAFKDSVPFLREAHPMFVKVPTPILYAITDPSGCEFQPYQIKPN